MQPQPRSILPWLEMVDEIRLEQQWIGNYDPDNVEALVQEATMAAHDCPSTSHQRAIGEPCDDG